MGEAQLKSAGLEFKDVPLQDLRDFFWQEYGIQLQLDEIAIEEMGVCPDEPISVDVGNVSLRSALSLLLRKKPQKSMSKSLIY
jgi:hypothetical protein